MDDDPELDDPELDDPELDAFTLLGRGDDDLDVAADDDRRRHDERRTKLVALTGLAVVVVIIGVVIALVRLVDTGDAPARTPEAAAQSWVSALIRGDDAARERLQCTQGSRTADTLTTLHGVQARGARIGSPHRRTVDRWDVPVTLVEPDGSLDTPFPVPVVRERGRYSVC